MKFSSEGCEQAATDLNTAAATLDKIINTNLENIMSKIKAIYESPAAEDMFTVHTNMKTSFKDFEDAVIGCKDYLLNVVKPGYENIEKAAQSKIQK